MKAMKQIMAVITSFTLILCSCSTIKHTNLIGERIGHDEYLIYVIGFPPDQRQLVLYDPIKETHTPLLSGWDIATFTISEKNRLAFSSGKEGKNQIYILDYPFTNDQPTRITPETSNGNFVFSWSPDGRYLAYGTVQDDGKTLYIWDGLTSSPIHHFQEQVNEIAWSEDGRLAFTDFYTFNYSVKDDKSEVFIWEGGQATSISQNPSGVDRFPAWNKEGKLAFLSERNGNYDIYIWDGISKSSGTPDINTYENIAPDLTDYMSHPIWTNSDTLTFIACGSKDRYLQVYEWDGQAAQNISQNPNLHNGSQQWREDGYWSFVTFFSIAQLVYIRDNNNQTLLVTKGQYTPAWSGNGRLLFCVNDASEWSLSMWDGEKVTKITQGPHIEATWQNGAGVFCSFG